MTTYYCPNMEEALRIQQWDGGYDCICFQLKINPDFIRIHLPIAVE